MRYSGRLCLEDLHVSPTHESCRLLSRGTGPFSLALALICASTSTVHLLTYQLGLSPSTTNTIEMTVPFGMHGKMQCKASPFYLLTDRPTRGKPSPPTLSPGGTASWQGVLLRACRGVRDVSRSLCHVVRTRVSTQQRQPPLQ